MEGYRQDWTLSFEKDTRTRGGWYLNHLWNMFYYVSNHHTAEVRILTLPIFLDKYIFIGQGLQYSSIMNDCSQKTKVL